MGKLFLNHKDFFSLIVFFLSKQSRNSLANWWSVCFKMFFPNVVICGVASATLSHRVWKLFLCSATKYENYFYALLFYFWNAKFLLLNCFLSELSWRNSFAMKLYGNCYLNRLFLSQSSRRAGEMIAFLRALRNIGDVLERSRIFGWQV